MGFEEAKEAFKDLLVDDLINDILVKYDLDSPQECKECSDIYNIGEALEYKDCFICCRRMCPTCIPTSSWGLNDPPKGLLPVCFCCEEKFSKKKIVRSDKEPSKEEKESDPEAPTEDEDIPRDNRKETDKTTNKNLVKDKVCRHYIMNRCKHGKLGEDCKDSHPKLCFGFLNKGKEGCPRLRNKEVCQFFHPEGCRYGEKCKNVKCNFFHSKHEREIKKKKSSSSDQTPVAAQEATKETPKEVVVVKEPLASKSSGPQGFQEVQKTEDTSQMFKCLMESMQEMSKNMNMLIQSQQWSWNQYQTVSPALQTQNYYQS